MLHPARQLGLLLRLLIPVPAVAVSFILPSSLSADTLTALVSGPLCGRDLLVVSENHGEYLFDVDQVVRAAGASITPVFLATQHSLLHTIPPVHQTKGSLLTALILFYHDPTTFLLLLSNNKDWNPGYLILFCLDPHLNTSSVLSQPVVQRSEFILLLQPQDKAGRRRMIAYTSLPACTKTPLGVWSAEKFHARHMLFPSRFQDFRGRVWRVPVVCYDEPFVYRDYEHGGCKGGNSDALKIIGDKHNFTHVMWEIDTLIWGTKQNGSWDGMLGKIMYHGSNLVFSSMKLNMDRFNDFDFSYPYWRYSFGLMLRVPQPMPRWKSILYPFSTVIWTLVISTTFVSSGFLAIILNRLFNVKDPVDITLKVVSGLLGQAMDDKRVRDYPFARVWLIFWWVAVDIIAAAYVSNLMSVLTVPVYPHRIQTLEELAYSNVIPAIMDYGGIVPAALNASTNPVYIKLGHKLYLDPIVDLNEPHSNLIRMMLEKGSVAIIDSIDYITNVQNKNNLSHTAYIMDEKLYKDYMLWFLPRNTPYTATISDRLQRIVETGILGHIYDVHLASLPSPSNRVAGSGVLSLDHLQGAFIALVMGGLVASFVLGLELLISAFTRH